MRTAIITCLLSLSACFLEDNKLYCNQENEQQVCTMPNMPCNYAHHKCEPIEEIIQGGSPVVTGITPMAAKTGDAVTLIGQNFTTGMKVLVGSTVVDAVVLAPTQMSFIVPQNASCGMVTVRARTADMQAVTGQVQL